MKRFLPLLLLICVIVLSGCINQPSSMTSTNGVIIETFGPEVDEVEPDEEIGVIGLIKNVGGAKVTDIEAQLLGLTDEWKFDPGRTIEIRDLLPPDPDRGLEGEEEEIAWFLTSPKKKVKLTYDMELRVYFDYETSYGSTIRIATRDYIDTFPSDKQKAEREKLGVSEDISTTGPITVNAIARSKVIKKPGEEFSVTLDIQNVGGGVPENDEIRRIVIKSDDKDITGECTGIDGNKLRLSRGKSRQIRCTVDTDGIPEGGWGEISISAELEYRYWVSSVSSITVLAEEIT